MNAAHIIHEAARHGCNITVLDGSLKLSAPRPLPDELMDEIRQHKPELIAELAPLPHGSCCQCGTDAECMLTRPDGSWDWQCIPCFDRGAGVFLTSEKAHSGEIATSVSGGEQ